MTDTFESRRTVEHVYTFTQGTKTLVSPFDPDIEVTGLIISASRSLISDDPDIDTEYVDVTVKARGFKFNRNGKRAALSHTFYINRTEVEANPWAAELVEKAREEASV